MTRFFGGDPLPPTETEGCASLRTWCFRPSGLATEQGEVRRLRERLDLSVGWLLLDRLVYGRRAGQARAILDRAHGQVCFFYASRGEIAH